MSNDLMFKIRAYRAYQAADPILYVFTAFPEFTREEMVEIATVRELFDAMYGDGVPCSECGQPFGGSHLGTCSMSMMSTGKFVPVGSST